LQANSKAIPRIMNGIVTLDEFIIQKQKDFKYSSGEFSRLLRDIGLASKLVHREVNKAGLVKEILGKTGGINVQGEEVQKLDEYANTRFIEALKLGEECAGICTEEMKNFLSLEDKNSRSSKYVIVMDPLDGSSNIDVNVSVGTIFSLYRRQSKIEEVCRMEDFLQPGTKQVAAGYIIYGSSTMLVYTAGHGVNGFTLDPSIGEFCLSHPDIKIPEDANLYSFNYGNFPNFYKNVKQYIIESFSFSDKNTPISYRYIGSMVADIHRNMLKGGIFMYPATSDSPQGKLRLLYECNPMAFIVEQAGGIATNGTERILDIKPTELHQRTPFYAGSRNMVERVKKFLSAA